jgi:large subunit ribosomal protein L35
MQGRTCRKGVCPPRAGLAAVKSPFAIGAKPYNGEFELEDLFELGQIARATMPKQKTHKGVKKRFRVTAKGKVMHRQSGTSHLAARMTHKRKRKLRGTKALDKEFTQQIVTVLAGNSY